jgi:hypothetical protein
MVSVIYAGDPLSLSVKFTDDGCTREVGPWISRHGPHGVLFIEAEGRHLTIPDAVRFLQETDTAARTLALCGQIAGTARSKAQKRGDGNRADQLVQKLRRIWAASKAERAEAGFSPPSSCLR